MIYQPKYRSGLQCDNQSQPLPFSSLLDIIACLPFTFLAISHSMVIACGPSKWRVIKWFRHCSISTSSHGKLYSFLAPVSVAVPVTPSHAGRTSSSLSKRPLRRKKKCSTWTPSAIVATLRLTKPFSQLRTKTPAHSRPTQPPSVAGQRFTQNQWSFR